MIRRTTYWTPIVPVLLLSACAALAQSEDALDHYAKGIHLAETEARYREAITEFERALDLRPRFHEACFSIGQCYGSLQDFQAAYGFFRRVVEMAPTPELATRARIAAGHVLLLGGRYEEAASALRSVQTLAPADGRLARLLGDAHSAIGQTERATAYYRRALELAPDAVEAHRGLAQGLRRRGDLVGAIHHANAAIGQDPYDSATFYVLAMALRRQRKLNEAREAMAAFHALQAYEADVKKLARELLDWPTRAELLLALADRHASAGNAEEAMAVYERLVAMDLARAVALTNMGLLRFDGSAFAEAESLFRQAIRLDPSLPQAYLGLATLHARQRRWEEAQAAFEAAVRAAPADAQAHLGLIACLAQLGNEAAAIEAAAEWTRRDPSSSLAWGERGLIHYHAGDAESAICALEKAVELDSDNVEAANGLAWIYAERGQNLEHALQLLEHVLATHPHANAYDTLAAVHEKRGDTQAAVDAMARAVEVQPENERYRTRLDELMRAAEGERGTP